MNGAWRMGLAGTGVLLAAAASACSAGVPRHAAAVVPGQQLLLDSQHGYARDGNAVPGYVSRFAYRHAASCLSRQVRDGQGRLLELQARWTYSNGVLRLHRVRGAFITTRMSLIDPFLTFRVLKAPVTDIPNLVQHRWVTTQVLGNHVKGYYATPWVTVGLTAREPAHWDPFLDLQLWALSEHNEFYCVADTSITLNAAH